MPQKTLVCRVSELKPGERKIVQVGKKSIGVFNVDGDYYAVLNVCPHQMAPLCEGRITGTCSASKVGEYGWAREGEIIRCPWHNWEFDIKTGQSVFNPHAVRTRTYPVAVETPDTEAAEATAKAADIEVFVSLPFAVEFALILLMG
ncbi:MAG: Rieske (2Fe-2S) protein, partial [Puniceicoccaceae bacterium]